jgi:proline iminopeptidase
MALRSVLAAATGLLLLSVAAAGAEEKPFPDELFPVAKPRKEGWLAVSDLHTLRYRVFGNPEGRPVIVLHGGPGFGSYPRLTQYFDPGKYLVVLHDQRGAGESRPQGELRENTTGELVADIERLREHLGIEGKVCLFGGSWGSTLALAYAEAHPDRVAAMVLRGIFLGTRAEADNLYGGPGPRLFFPDALEAMSAALPPGKPFTPETLSEIFNGPESALRRRVALAWTRYSLKLCRLHVPDEMLEDPFGLQDPIPACRIDCHYASNGFFLQDGEILAKADRIRNIPVTIVNGRYDMVTPPASAYRLHRALPRSRLVIVAEAGHSESEEGTTRALLRAVAESFE